MTAETGLPRDDLPLLAPSTGFQWVAGVRVPDLTSSRAVPHRTTRLVHLGADEVEVERAAVGDDSRRWGPPFLEDHADGEPSGYRLPPRRLDAHRSQVIAEWLGDHFHPTAHAADTPGTS